MLKSVSADVSFIHPREGTDLSMKYFLIILASLFGLAVLYVLWYTVSALLVDGKREYESNSRYYRFLLDSATAFWLWAIGVRIHVTGKDKLPKGRFLLVSNHRSNFDPIVTWRVFAHENLAFISKEKNFHIPWFGRIIRRCAFMCIDRENPRNAIKTVNKAARLIENDVVSVALYPEGTRSKKLVLLPFHNGMFMIAQKSKAPVVVIAVQGTELIQKKFPFRRSHVYIDVVDVIDAGTVASTKTDLIGERVREDMERALSVDKVNTPKG